MIPCGLDLGNRRVKLHLLGLSASVPAIMAFDKPIVISDKTGLEIKPKAFSLLFRIDNKDLALWFGRDVALSQSILQELDQSKYVKSYIQRIFQAVLYQWATQHKQDPDNLDKLNIVASMPPGLYQKPIVRKQAETAYRKAFNTGQAHIQLRDGQHHYQIVTQFAGLQREATLSKRNDLVLVVDLGGGTTDFTLFNGSIQPVDSRSFNNGLYHTYQKIDPVHPHKIEYRIMSNKSYFPDALLGYYSDIKLMVQAAVRGLPKQPDKIYLIGGGADLMPKMIRQSFKRLANQVIIKDQYTNAINNWKHAKDTL